MTQERQASDREQLEQAITALESQRAILGNAVVDAALAPMREKLSALLAAQPAGQQRKMATVLFMDIVGSTALTRDLDPEDTMAIMDTALQRLARPVYTHGGRVIRFMGDGFLALFGAPVARENEPEMAVRAGLQVLAEAKVYAREAKAQWRIEDFQIRVGISSGLIFIGGDSEAENTIMGATVNLAARLESAAEPGTLLISHHTHQHIQDVFDMQPVEPITVKGFDAPVQVYRVQQAMPAAYRMSMRSVAGVETRMIGRDPELLMLQNMFRDATEEAEAHVVTIVGDAGVGKSRLLYEFEQWIDSLTEQVWYFIGRATPETTSRPYGLIRRMFATRFDILDSDSAVEVRQKFRAGMSATLNIDQADLVGHLLGLDFSASPAVEAHLGSDSFGELATSYLARYLRALADEPMVMFLEDIHWADDSSLDLIDQLMLALPDTRLLVVCLARPPLFERRPNWGEGREGHTQIELKPLSRRASRALVGEIVQVAGGVPSELRDLIVEGAEGNPFYVEELIKMLIEDGVIVPGPDQWRIEIERLAGVHVPATLTGVLQARLDCLPAEEKRLLQRAAVVGRLFWDAAVLELKAGNEQNLDEEEIAPLLGSIRERELVFRRERSAFAGTEEYIFKHALLRDVTYETVLLKLRRVYHEQVAHWLESATGERIGEYLGLIASHYELAGQGEKAVEYLLRAGDRARLAYANQEAIGYYRRAFALLDQQGKQEKAARTLMKLGLTYHAALDFRQARQAYDEGFALWQQSGELPPAVLPPAAPHALRVSRLDPPTLDPNMAEGTTSGAIICPLFSGLVDLSPQMNVVPEVAHSWEVLEGGRKYIFYLRDDVCWSDGTPVTAADFAYSWKRILDPANGSPVANMLYGIKGAQAFHQAEGAIADVGIESPDDHTLVVELEEPTSYFLSLLTHRATYPVPRHAVEAHGEAWTELDNLVTNGPFRVEAWQRGRSMTLSRNPAYQGRFTGNVQRVELSFFTSEQWSDVLAMYEAGELDMLDLLDLPPQDRDRLRQRHAGEYVTAPLLSTLYVVFDTSRPPFDDARVRRAFILAANREKLADEVWKGYYSAASGGFVPDGMPGHSFGIGLPYDPERARQLLAEAGYPGGRGFPAVEAVMALHRVSEYLQEQWRENLGLEISWQSLEVGDFISRLDRDPPHLNLFAWGADYPDPDNFLRVCPARDRAHWQNERYDSLVEEAWHIADQEERLAMYRQADKILVEEAAIMPLLYQRMHLLVKPWVSKYPTTAIRVWFWKDVIIEPH